MGLFNKWFKKEETPIEKAPIKTIDIQASEGYSDSVIIESMMTQRRVNLSIPGTTNAYNNYDSQVAETYRKYNGFSDFGTQQVRTIVDLRTAFIAGEGISVSVENKETADFLEWFVEYNKLDSINFINGVKGSEMAGQALYKLHPSTDIKDDSLIIKASRIPYCDTFIYKPIFKDMLTRDEVLDIAVKSEFGWRSAGLSNFVYLRTGGDDSNSYGPSTKVGVVLTDIENYDRAIKDMRRNNHIFARVTPVFQTDSDADTVTLANKLNGMRWRIGEVFIGKAKFSYETPKNGAHENLLTEMIATIKTISGNTSVPVHWFGYVDLMSNRSTAQSLYELIKNGTAVERTVWEKGLYELMLKAQELYINSGGKLTFNKDFQVRLPLISFEDFLDLVRALTIAYADEAISMDDYRNALPGIDPTKTERAIEKEREKEKEELIKSGENVPPDNLDDPNEKDNPDKTKEE